MARKALTDEQKAKRAVYDRAYYEANRDRRSTQKRAWAVENRERLRQLNKAWYQANRERKRPEYAAYREANRDRSRTYTKAWILANPDRVHQYRTSKRARRLAQMVEPVNPTDVFDRDGGRCQCDVCYLPDRRIGDGKWEIDHIVPLSLGGPHSYANVRLAHALCNNRRHTAARETLQLRMVV